MRPWPPEGGDDPVGDPPLHYEPPAGGFTWSVPRRYGLDDNHDLMTDAHYNPATFNYEPDYIYPDVWPMSFFGCQTDADAEAGASTTNSYVWNINGAIINDGRCRLTYNGFTQQGTYTVTLTYTPQVGRPSLFHSRCTSETFSSWLLATRTAPGKASRISHSPFLAIGSPAGSRRVLPRGRTNAATARRTPMAP